MAAHYGYIVAVLYIVLKACIAIALWGAAMVGFLLRPMALWERVLATAAAFSLVLALPATDEMGFALAAILVGLHVWRARIAAPPEPAP